MAEMLVFAVDRKGADPFMDSKLPKRGHVITIQEDKWPWGAEEIKGVDFVVVKCPGVSVLDLTPFVGPELPTAPLATGETRDSLTNVLQPRAFRFDLDNAAVPKGVAVVTLDIPLATLTDTLRLTVPSLSNPNVIGGSSR